MYKRIILLLLISVLLMGCLNKNTIESTQQTKQDVAEDINISLEGVEKVIMDCDNLNKSNNIIINVPKVVHGLYKFTSTYGKQDMKEYDRQFRDIFEYLYPERKINDEYLFYVGGNSSQKFDENGQIIETFKLVSDNITDIVNNHLGEVTYLYDENWLKDMVEWRSPVCLELGSPIGAGYGIINKGKTMELSQELFFEEGENSRVFIEKKGYPSLEGYDPADWLEYVATYEPNSAQEYRLWDKNVKIKDAVEFFEKYINNIPYPKNSNMRTIVKNVDVYKVTDEIYGFYFNTTAEYMGISYDHMKNGTVLSDSSEYSTCSGNGFMVESTDIDIIYGYYKYVEPVEMDIYKNIYPLDAAINLISEKMTHNIVFDVERIELVYTEKPKKNEAGYIDIENPSEEVVPAWKVSLYNANDNTYYICFVDAVDGGNYRYYRTVIENE